MARLQPRPLYAHVARHNIASRRVLEKCGFVWLGEETAPTDAAGAAITEDILILRERTDDRANQN
jgi:RimJ/RimL family protein N-acetyltransferase